MSGSFYELHRNSIRKIAIFRALKLGDLLCSVPAFRALRHAFPQAEISLISLPWAEEFIRRFHIYLDRFIPFPGYPGLPEQPINPPKIVNFLQTMQKEKFDLVLQMQGNGTIVNGMIELLGAKHTAGFYPKNHIEQYCPNPDTFTIYPERDHEIHRLLALIEYLGIPRQDDYVEFPIFDADKQELATLNGFQQIENNPYICIHAGGISAQRWPEENFAQVADQLYELGLQIVLTGTTAEQHITHKIQHYMKHNAIDASDKTTLGTLALVLQQTSLVISNDTGVSHIAAAVQAPSVIIFTTSDPKQWAPLNKELHKAIFKYHASVENVMREAKKLLRNHPTNNISRSGFVNRSMTFGYNLSIETKPQV